MQGGALVGYQCPGESWGWTGAEVHQGFQEQRYAHAIIMRSQDRAFAATLNSYFMLELIRVCCLVTLSDVGKRR